MKLKLENHEGTTVLSVSEGIDLAQIAILKAGLNKIFLSGRKVVLLDLTPLETTQPPVGDVLPELVGLPTWATDNEALLLVVSGIEGLGQAKTADEGLAKLASPLFKLMAEEARLRVKIRMLQVRKAEVEVALAKAAGSSGPLAQEQKKNSDLKRLVAELEGTVRKRFKPRSSPGAQEPITQDAALTRIQGIEKALVAILEQEGLLPVT